MSISLNFNDDLTDNDVKDIVSTLRTAGFLLLPLDLEAYVDRCNKVNAFGCFADPTGYRDSREQRDNLTKLAQAGLAFRKVVMEIVATEATKLAKQR